MTTTPRLGAPELVSAQATPETTVNEQIRYVEQGASYFIIKDKDLTSPPGSPVDGDAYIVAATATGAWAGKETKIAFRMSTGWLYVTPIEGTLAYAQDEDTRYIFNGSAWAADSSGGGGGGGVIVTPSTQSGTSYTAALTDAPSSQNYQGYIQFTNTGAVTFTIPPNASVAFPIGTVISVEQNNTGTVTLTAGSGVTLNSRGGLLATAGRYAVAQAKKVATNTWTVIGDVA